MIDSKQSQFDTSHALRFFPTLVWKADLKRESFQRINDDILNRLLDMRASLPELQPGQAWQSDHAPHQFDEFRELVSCINEIATDLLDLLKIGYHAFEITACWANVSAPGAAQRRRWPGMSARRVPFRAPSGRRTRLTMQRHRPRVLSCRGNRKRDRVGTKCWIPSTSRSKQTPCAQLGHPLYGVI